MKLNQKLDAYTRLLRLDKPIGILLLLWPTLWGLWIGGMGQPSPFFVWIFVVGTILMRSAGCAINDYADREFDGHVERTQARPIVSGEVSPREALVIAASLALFAFILILPMHRLVLILSVPALLVAASYPFTKRFFAIPQAYLGIAFGFGIPMAFAAQQFQIPALAWWLLLANVFWSLAYDTEYAMVDRADDVKIGIHTAAITFGRFDVAAIFICYSIMLGLLIWCGYQAQRGFLFYLGIVAAAGIALYHISLIKDRDPQKCFKAFLHNNWIGATIFIGLYLDYKISF